MLKTCVYFHYKLGNYRRVWAPQLLGRLRTLSQLVASSLGCFLARLFCLGAFIVVNGGKGGYSLKLWNYCKIDRETIKFHYNELRRSEVI